MRTIVIGSLLALLAGAPALGQEPDLHLPGLRGVVADLEGRAVAGARVVVSIHETFPAALSPAALAERRDAFHPARRLVIEQWQAARRGFDAGRRLVIDKGRVDGRGFDTRDVAEGVTDEDGAFVIDQPIRVPAGAHLSVSALVSEGGVVHAGTFRDPQFGGMRRRGGTSLGRDGELHEPLLTYPLTELEVSSLCRGAPVPGAEVRLSGGRRLTITRRADASGLVSVVLPRHAPLWVEVGSELGGTRVRLCTEGREQRVTLDVAHPLTIRGRAVDANGWPLSDLWVHAEALDARWPWADRRLISAKSDERGAFELREVAAGARYRLVLQATEGMASPAPVIVAPPSAEVELRPELAASIELQLEFGDFERVQGIDVVCERQEPSGAWVRVARDPFQELLGPGAVDGRPSPVRVRLRRVPPGRVRLTLRLSGVGTMSTGPIDLRAGVNAPMTLRCD